MLCNGRSPDLESREVELSHGCWCAWRKSLNRQTGALEGHQTVQLRGTRPFHTDRTDETQWKTPGNSSAAAVDIGLERFGSPAGEKFARNSQKALIGQSAIRPLRRKQKLNIQFHAVQIQMLNQSFTSSLDIPCLRLEPLVFSLNFHLLLFSLLLLLAEQALQYPIFDSTCAYPQHLDSMTPCQLSHVSV